jgi:hypothetical protein
MRHLLQKLPIITKVSMTAIILLSAGTASAEMSDEAREALLQKRAAQYQKQKQVDSRPSWALAFDNDVLVPGSRDQDYTYGINLTLAGNQVENHWAAMHQPLDWINNQIGLDGVIGQGTKSGKIEYGLFGFTPEDKTVTAPQQDDRPYASLIYVSSSRENYDSMREVSWQSTLTLGVLGLSVVGDLQDTIHSTIGVEEAKGWDNQISEGGELTARYSISRQSLLSKNASGFEVKSTIQGSIGYITEASLSLSARAGKIRSPWVSFNPELGSYGEKANPNARVKVSEQYAWAGIAIKYRAYNAFLEGQFKDSVVTYSDDEINRGIVEAWLGYTLGFDDGYSISYSIRGHSSELKQGNADRNVVWGGLLVSKTFL